MLLLRMLLVLLLPSRLLLLTGVLRGKILRRALTIWIIAGIEMVVVHSNIDAARAADDGGDVGGPVLVSSAHRKGAFHQI